MMHRLTTAFKEKNQAKILKLSAEIGHDNLLIRLAFMVFGKAVYRNYWQINNVIFLLVRPPIYKTPQILSGSVCIGKCSPSGYCFKI
jgi:hypothetical protein